MKRPPSAVQTSAKVTLEALDAWTVGGLLELWHTGALKCARFTCSQCQYSWSSHRVAILFHLHWEQQERRGAVWMRPFKQKCSECPSEKYEEAQFTDADVASVIHHLIFDIREKCYREHVDRGELPEVFWDVATAGLRHPQCEAFRIDLSPLRGGQAEVAVHPGRPQGAVQPGDPQPPLHCWIVNNQSAALPLTQRLNPTAQCVRIVAACAVLTVVILVVIGLVWFFRRIL
ncbi:receptor-transporting protein 3-like isoform X2 [Paroedura picta]|uniref:receptor-transporting protein 3-like isoform X2 n=1 Tax=Paroedura picta TaxID=143630 RepID=UPI0040579B33